jgi:hypothetical protein
MSTSKPSVRGRGQEARIVVHADEHAIVKEILCRALGDDACFAKVVSGERSESERIQSRLVLAGFLRRLERQFDLREKTGTADDLPKSNGTNGRATSGYRSRSA